MLASFRNKTSDKEYKDSTGAPAEIRFFVNGADVSASSWQWKLRSDHVARGEQNELQLEIELDSPLLRVTKHYMIYPATSVIREWLILENTSSKPIRISQLDFLHSQVLASVASDLDFNYVTGGGNYNGSQLLKSEPMSRGFHRVFDSKGGAQPESYSSYLPLIFLHNRSTNDGIALGWDYLGHWRFEVGGDDEAPLAMSLELTGFQKDLAPNEKIETPKAFMAPFSGGVDQLGNQLLDWQYAYMWEFTNPEYFAKTRWGLDWPEPWYGNGGTPSADNWGRRLALDLRYVDLMRETGTDILWDDAGWYDKWGTWNAPAWKLTNDFVHKYGMRWVLWYPTFLATPESKVAQAHPDWIIEGRVLDQSIPATVDWQKRLLDNGVKDWGEFQWRFDVAPAVSANDTDSLDSDQNFRKLMEAFKVDHPRSGIDACYGGGRWISYDVARLSDSGEYTDGGVGPYSAYYTSLIVPPDKLHNVIDFDHTYYNRATDHTHLSMDPTWYRDPGDGPDLESIRHDWELYHYLATQGVVGRWSHIFRPKVDHDDAIWYLQRMNRDASKGVILAKHEKRGATYYVTSQLSKNAKGSPDQYYGGPNEMNSVTTTSVASIDTGIYQDPIDGAIRFYGVTGQAFGPLNMKYQSGSADVSFVTSVPKVGGERPVTDRLFGMALQVDNPLILTQLGQFDPEDRNHGIYVLSVIRADDDKVVATTELDMGQTHPDALGFKYARLPEDVQLDAAAKPVTIYPGGLSTTAIYEVRGSNSNFRVSESGSKLMSEGITLNKVPAGEMIFLNLPHYPGSGTDHVAPTTPSQVIKKVGTNLGAQGIEISWLASRDDNWLSYYEVHKDGKPIGKTAVGTFFFDHSATARNDIDKVYEVMAVDGDGNHSAAVAADKTAGVPRTYEALGDFSSTQSADQWTYEETLENGSYRQLLWDKGGYRGCGGDQG